MASLKSVFEKLPFLLEQNTLQEGKALKMLSLTHDCSLFKYSFSFGPWKDPNVGLEKQNGVSFLTPSKYRQSYCSWVSFL